MLGPLHSQSSPRVSRKSSPTSLSTRKLLLDPSKQVVSALQVHSSSEIKDVMAVAEGLLQVSSTKPNFGVPNLLRQFRRPFKVAFVSELFQIPLKRARDCRYNR